MTLPEICINRPVFAIVLSIVIMVLGALGFSQLETRYFPNVNSYSIYIETTYPGANATLIETTINSKIEDAVNTIGGIDTLKSTASQGSGTVTIRFRPGVNFSDKANEVRDKVAGIRGQLPSEIEPPIVNLGNEDDMLLDISFTSSTMDPAQIRDYVDRYVKDAIQQIPGISAVLLEGANDYAMRIWLEPEKMAARNITVGDIQSALVSGNVQLPAGEFKSTTMYFPVQEDTQLHSAAEFNNLTAAARNGNIIRINDIGHAEWGLSGDPTFIRVDGKPAVDADIYLEIGANPIAVSEAVYKAIKRIAPTLPFGMKMKVSYNTATFLKASIHEVYYSIFFAILCVLAVIFLFLGNLRAVLIPVVTIPICIIGVFGLIAVLGYSINMLTLLAIVLAIGLVVDDAVVVLENVYRHLEQGESPKKAAVIGSNEIIFAVIAMTITLIAVYMPVGFMSDRAALIFREFAFTLAGAVLISGFVALTLSPSMCALLLRQGKSNNFSIKIDHLFERLKKSYLFALDKLLANRLKILLIGILLLICGGIIFYYLPKEFAPDEDMGIIITSLKTPTGSNTAYTFNYVQQVEQQIQKIPERYSLFSVVESNKQESGNLFLFLKPEKNRKRSAKQIADEMNVSLQKIPGISISSFAISPFTGAQKHGLEVKILTSDSYEVLNKTMQELLKKLKSYPGLINAQSSVKFDSQQFNLIINRDLANNLGISIRDIDHTIATLLGGSYFTDFYLGNKSYKVKAQASSGNIASVEDLSKFYVRSQSGNLVSLDNLIKAQPFLAQPDLDHYNRLRSATLSAELAPGYTMNSAINYLNKNLPEWLPPDTKYAFSGLAKEMLESGQSAGLLFLLALAFIFLVLAAQFESFIDPLIILLTVPLSIVGALAVLGLVGGSVNLYTAIGLITLVGLITKHGILIVQFANQLQSEGLAIFPAIRQAAAIRLRPILMTTGAMALGAIPLAFATGTGAASRSQIGWVIVGGLLFGTFFSLGVIPVAYSYFSKFARKSA